MQLKNLLILFLFLTFTYVNAQNHPTCDGTRYLEDVFTAVDVTTGINFGAATTISGNEIQLDMDIYEPGGDTAEERPVIILGFGGSFIGGMRTDLDFLCRAYAEKGYVAVTIDYRLYDGPLFPLPSGETMQDVVTRTVADFKAAVRFFREDADGPNTYRVDPNHIFLGGISAGAIAAAHAAVMDSTDTYSTELAAIIEANGGIEGNSSDNLQYSSEVQGFINFSGALGDAGWIDENDPPFFSVHDEFDGTVPYGEGFATIFGFEIIYMEGSSIMKEAGDDVGISNNLNTIEGSNGHVSYMVGQSGQMAAIDSSAAFLYELLCGEFVSSVESKASSVDVVVYPNPTNGLVFLQGMEGENITIVLRDVLGQELMVVENAVAVDVARFGQGVYFMEILKDGGKVVKRVVVE